MRYPAEKSAFFAARTLSPLSDRRKYRSPSLSYINSIRSAVPNGAVISEIKREIEEGALLCPAIRSVYDFNLSGNTVSFTVSLDDGEERELTIEL